MIKMIKNDSTNSENEKRFVKGCHTIRDIKENYTYDFQVNIICDLLNALHEENQKLLQLNRNQGYLIYQLHEQLLYRLSEEGGLKVILTPEDLELMGKAISYYEHNWSDEDEK